MTVRYRLMATYRGVPYEAGVGPTDGDVVLFAACPPPEELGFEPATGHWRKQLRIGDVQSLWESRPTGRFRGERCMVLDDLGDRLHIAFLGHDSFKAEQLGYWEVDRGVFEVIAPRDEVAEITEERLEFPYRAGASDPPATADRPGLPGDTAAPGRPGLAGDTAAPGGPAWAVLPAGPPGRVERDLNGLGGVSPVRERPLPLEEAARLAASARAAATARLAESPVAEQLPGPGTWPTEEPEPPEDPQPPEEPRSQPDPGSEPSRRRDSALRRLATQRSFSELAGLAAIPQSAFAVGEEVDGAMCLIQTPDGFEVFNSADGARHELRLFDDEESAYFYLFGILAAEAVRTGRLAPQD
jgi:hypothetical protein